LNNPPITRGSVIRYAYLWKRERERAQDEGIKDRPTIVMALSVQVEDEATRVYVLAVTHTPPRSDADAIQMPPAAKRHLGLDDDPAWIITTEANTFLWPGPDIRPIPGRASGTVVYGRIPDNLLRRVIASYVENATKKRTTIVSR
jgi:hypothetical protein